MKPLGQYLHWQRIPPGVRFLLSITASVVAFKIAAVFGHSHWSFLRDVGQNVDLPAAAGGGGAGLGAGLGWPGGKDPYPYIGTPDNPNTSPGPQGGGGNQEPWWEKWIPSSWTTITVGPISIDTKTGHVSFGPVDVGVTPGGDPRGPIIDIGYKTPVGTIPVASPGIPQPLQQSDSSPMGGQGSQGGAWVGPFVNGGT